MNRLDNGDPARVELQRLSELPPLKDGEEADLCCAYEEVAATKAMLRSL